MMRKRAQAVRLLLAGVMAVLGTVAVTAPASADSERVSRSVVFDGRTFAVIPHSFTVLVRERSAMLTVAQVSQLPAGNTVQIRAQVFNNPAACSHPDVTPNQGLCGGLDTLNPATGFQVLPGPTVRIDAEGRAHFVARFSAPGLNTRGGEVIYAFRTFDAAGNRICGSAPRPACFNSVHRGVVDADEDDNEEADES